jgi:predicted dienelactone hydrolase
MEGLLVLVAIIAVLALVDALAVSFGAESRETFVDPRLAARPAL